MKKQFSTNLEQELIDKLDRERAKVGLSRNAALSILVANFGGFLSMRWKGKVEYGHNSLTCTCPKCVREQDEAERSFEDARGN